ARDRLLESGAAEAMRDRHLACFLALAEKGAPELEGPDQKAWLIRFEEENENLRTALSWGLESGCAIGQAAGMQNGPDGNAERRAAAAICLAGALWWSWRRRSTLNEGRAWLEQALRVADTLPAAAPDTDSTAGHFAATGEWPLSPAAVARV